MELEYQRGLRLGRKATSESAPYRDLISRLPQRTEAGPLKSGKVTQLPQQ